MKALLILAGAALAFATPAAAQEMVVNGGFETGSLSSFMQTGNTGFTGVDAPSAASGNFGAFFGPVGSVGRISQPLATTVGQSYLISFDLRNLSGGTPNFYEVLFGNSQLFTASNSSVFGYTNFSTTAVATGTSTVLMFNFQHNPSFFLLDNVSVTPSRVTGAVPEPATWAMMLIGFGAIGVSLRRRRTVSATLKLA